MYQIYVFHLHFSYYWSLIQSRSNLVKVSYLLHSLKSSLHWFLVLALCLEKPGLQATKKKIKGRMLKKKIWSIKILSVLFNTRTPLAATMVKVTTYLILLTMQSWYAQYSNCTEMIAIAQIFSRKQPRMQMLTQTKKLATSLWETSITQRLTIQCQSFPVNLRQSSSSSFLTSVGWGFSVVFCFVF